MPDTIMAGDPIDNDFTSIRGFLSNDNAVIFGSLSQLNNRLMLYKVYSDGRIAGDVNEVPESSNRAEPGSFILKSAYPNPFNPIVNIPFTLPMKVSVKISVYNILGEHVTTLLNKPMEAGIHHVTWDADKTSAKAVSSGIYFVQMQAGTYIETRKVLLIR
jgi:hypothetical protein